MASQESFSKMKEECREFIKGIPYEEIVKCSNKYFPDLTSRAISRDKLVAKVAMIDLATALFTKGCELAAAEINKSHVSLYETLGFLLCATSVYWEDIEKQ